MTTKRELGSELRNLLQTDKYLSNISRWAYRMYSLDPRNMDNITQRLLLSLVDMEDDPQFELSKEEIREIADRLINEGEKEELGAPIPGIRKIAEDLGDAWLMCPLCQEAWQSRSTYGMVECPTCKSKLHNPKFQALGTQDAQKEKKSVETNWNELWPIVNILNEVCHGIRINGFEDKIGTDYETVYDLLKKISSYEVEEIESNSSVKIKLSNIEEKIITKSYCEVLKQIEEWEFSTRIGISSLETDKIIKKLTAAPE